MASPSIEHLSKYLSNSTIFFELRYEDYSLNPRTCLVVICYAIKIRSDSSRDDIIRQLNDLASSTDQEKYERICTLFANSFVPLAKELFKVPKAEQLVEPPMKNEIMAGFLDFLLQILNSAEASQKPDKERVLRKELMCLLTFLGDVPFQRSDIDEMKQLLEEFEAVANEAGSLIYSSIFAVPGMEYESFNAEKCALLKKVGLLNSMIKQYFGDFVEFPMRFEAPRRSTIGGAADSLFIVDSLVADLEDLITGRFSLSVDEIKDEIKLVHEELTSSRALLKDFHDTDMDDEVTECLVNIRGVAYEAEYLVNLHVVGNVPLWYLSLRLPAVIHKVKVNGIRLRKTKKLCDSKVLRYYNQEVSTITPRPTVRAENLVIGFESNIIKILDDLIGGSKELSIISIVGMAGLGKTTMANKLYHDKVIYDYFDLRAWCVVSQTYQKRNLLIDIVTSMGRESEDDRIQEMKDEDLGLKIYQTLKGRRFLIVIDDVWHSNTWDDFRRYFPNDLNGSMIMLTSRIKDIAPGNSIFHTVPLLSDVQSWDLLAKKIFCNEPCLPQLLDIGKSIAAKCNGLPLLVIVVAGILGSLEKKENVWKKVESNLDSYVKEDESKCMKILELSYEHLPNNLKLCFLYMGVFPEDKIIPTRKLIWLWIAEGFIMKEDEQSLEDVAERYLLDLINRSLLQIAGRGSDGGIKWCNMHDLLRDMCLKIAYEANFLKSTKDHSSIYEKHHRLSDYSMSPSSWRHFGLHCRSILGHLNDLPHRFPQMGLVRVMDLLPSPCTFRSTNKLDLLVYLRYLVVDRMPGPEVAKLVNLEVLCVENEFIATHAVKIPSIFLKMERLTHLCIGGALGAKFEKGWDTCQTINLKSLSCISISDHQDEEILRCSSSNLCKLKCQCHGEVFPNLCSFTELESLTLLCESRRLKGQLAMINFPSTIKKLTLRETGLPWEDMSILGKLPKLVVLKLLRDSFVGEEWETRDGEFRALKFLKLSYFDLKQWVTESEHFPKLERLVLGMCTNQLEVPSDLGNIPTLQMIEVFSCSDKTNESVARIEEEQLEYGNEELKVVVRTKARDIFRKLRTKLQAYLLLSSLRKQK